MELGINPAKLTSGIDAAEPQPKHHVEEIIAVVIKCSTTKIKPITPVQNKPKECKSAQE